MKENRDQKQKKLFYYFNSNKYAKLSQNVQKDYMFKIQDLLKIESLVKEKFPLQLLKNMNY